MRTDVICYFKLGWRVQRVLPELTGAAGPVNRDMGSVSAPFTLLSQYRAPQIAKRKEISWLTSEEQTRFFFFSFPLFLTAINIQDRDKKMDVVSTQVTANHIGAIKILASEGRFNTIVNTQP